MIGGKYHRTKIEIAADQCVVKIAIPPNLTADQIINICETPVELEVEIYGIVDNILGEYGIFPEDVFLKINISPVEFLKTLVLDYVR